MKSGIETLSILPRFFQAAQEVLESELGTSVQLSSVIKSAAYDYTTRDVTVLVAVTGDLEGTALYSYSTPCALGVVSHLMGSPMECLDELAESGVAEVGNVITGRACVLFAEDGLTCNIAPPVVITGGSSHVHAPNIPRWMAVADTPYGPIDIHVAIRAVNDQRNVT